MIMGDWQIQEQAYGYFLIEAPELLQTIEQEILTLPNEHTTPKVHNLMRAIHTLKGAAASVNLDTIKTIAHELEDIVRVFYNLDVTIDSSLQSWLLEGYSALQSCLDEHILGVEVDEELIYEQFLHTIGQIKHQLGDYLAAEIELPSAIELGFDLVASIFETNIPEQIDQLQTALASQDLDHLSNTIAIVSEICTGLAESVELPGFLAISQAITAAVAHHPQKIEHIAQIAIANLQQARTEVLAGDRIAGGQVLPELALLAQGEDIPQEMVSKPLAPDFSARREAELTALRQFLTSDRFRTRQPLSPAVQDFLLNLIRLAWDWFEQCVDMRPSQLDLDLLIAAEGIPDLDYINHWVGLFLSQLREEEDSPSLRAYRRSCIYQVVFAVAKHLTESDTRGRIDDEFLEALRSQLQIAVKLSKQLPPITTTEKAWLDHVEIPHNWKKAIATTTPAESNLDDELLDQIWGQPQLLDLDLPQVKPLDSAETTVVSSFTLSELSDVYQHRSIHSQQLQSILEDLYYQALEQDRQLQNMDLYPNALAEWIDAREQVISRLSLAIQAAQQIDRLNEKQQELLDRLRSAPDEGLDTFQN